MSIIYYLVNSIFGEEIYKIDNEKVTFNDGDGWNDSCYTPRTFKRDLIDGGAADAKCKKISEARAFEWLL